MKSVCVFFLLFMVAVQAQYAKSAAIHPKEEMTVSGCYFLRDSAFVAELRSERIAVDTTGLFTFRADNPESFVKYAEALRKSSDRLGCEMEWCVANIFVNTLSPSQIKRLKELSISSDDNYIFSKYGNYLKDGLIRRPNETYVQSILHAIECGDFPYPVPIMFGSKRICYLTEDGSVYEDWQEIPVAFPEEVAAQPTDDNIPDNWREIQHKEYLAYVDTLRHQYEYLGKISVKDFEEFELVNQNEDIEEEEEEPQDNTEFLTNKRPSEEESTDNILQLKFDDGGIIKWRIPKDYQYSCVNVDTENFIIPMMKFMGKYSEIMIPVETIEWTFRNSDDWVLIQREWSDDWGSVLEEYSLAEKDGKVIIGNFPQEYEVEIYKDYESSECKNITVSGELVRDPSDDYHVVKFSATCVIINPIN